MAEVEFYEQQYERELVRFEELVDQATTDLQEEKDATEDNPAEKGAARAAADAASAQIRAVKVKQKNLKLELRTVKDRTTKAMVDGKVRQYDARFTTGQNSMKQILHELDRLELTSGAGGGSQYPTMGANDGMLNKVGKAQDNIDRSLTRTANMVNETQDVAAATLEEMKTQQEKITAIDEEIATIETRLGRADKLIKTFGKRMMTDKCIQVFFVINMLMVIGIIGYTIAKKKGYLNDDDKEPTPPTPGGSAPAGTPDTADGARRFLRGAW